MSDEETKLEGPDLISGVPQSSIAEGAMLLGHARGEPVILVRRGDDVFAVGATCTHYGAPLVDGLVVGDTLRCPWHHACFDLRNGDAVRAPALDPIACWRVERQGDVVRVREKRPTTVRPPPAATNPPETIVIVGGGAAGNAAAEMLRQEGYAGRITMLSADASLPVDRPTLSKGFLAGTDDEDAVPLRTEAFYREHDIDVKLAARVVAIDTGNRDVQLADGSRHRFDALLLATGAEPVKLDFPGADLPHVHYLRTAADSRALVDSAMTARHAVVIGSSFIGLEVAASLRARHVGVHVVGRDAVLMERVLGAEAGAFIRQLHEQNGVTFHLGATAVRIDAHHVTLSDGVALEADLVVVGVGVKPALALAESAGLAVDRGVTVDEYLQTSVPGIFAAGDIARWPDRLSGERIRVEHWVVAERQGQTAARNMLGLKERFDAVPFFWTVQYDFGLGYVGHAERFDSAIIDGSLEQDDCTIAYANDGRKLALAIVKRDLEGLHVEVEFERRIGAEREGVVR